MTGALLEVIALGPADGAAAQEGGADRLEVVTAMDADGLSPEPSVVASIRRRTSLPMRVMLRLEDTFSTSPSELVRLASLARRYADAGADGVVLGFLTPTSEIDVEAVTELVGRLDGMPWTFHRAVDHALDTDQAWRRLQELAATTAMDAVLTAGSARGMDAGLDDLTARAKADPKVAGLAMAGGGLRAEHVPWLAQAGIRAFHVGTSVRYDSSWKAYVDAKYVRAWRTLVDEEVARAAL
ncbi:MAG TPA: copper homeostasis protein CutC [Actinopolymorphaceae bacterium]